MPSKSSKQRTPRSDKARSAGAGRPLWSGTLSFGLVSIPVDVLAGTRAGGVALRLLSPEGVPLARRFYCPEDEEAVPGEHLVRGYEHARGQYVVVSDEELEGLAPEKSRDIDLRAFVPLADLDPVYFERSFYLLPTGTSSKAYHLLAAVIERSERAGIATFVMRDREYLVAIMAQEGLLIAQALRFADQVRSTKALDLPAAERLPAGAVEPFVAAIRKRAREQVDLTRLHNRGAEALRELAEKKAKNTKNVVRARADEDAASDAEVIDLLDVLQRSLQGKDGASKLKGTLKSGRGKGR